MSIKNRYEFINIFQSKTLYTTADTTSDNYLLIIGN